MDFVGQMSGVMSFSVRKRDIISNNIANQTTPEFKAENVVWKNAYEKGIKLSTSDERHIPLNGQDVNYEVEKDYSTEVNSDGNNVDMNRQIVEMMKNNQLYSMSLSALNSHYEAMGAARGGR